MVEQVRTGAERVIVLETPRLRLRHIVPADLDALVELDADPQVMRYISYGEPTPRARYEQEYLPRFIAYYSSTSRLGYWIAETRVDDQFVGWFHLRPDRIDAGEQEIGYRLRRAAWGRGYATELGRALVAHGFERVGAPVISARALRDNAASRRVMEKCGLTYERDFTWPPEVLPGRTPDERAGVKYALSRETWLRQQA
jgi:RimJ/RimL family protein N-acetyltransferase